MALLLPVALTSGGIAYIATSKSASDKYISALKAQGLISAFPGNRAAIITGRKVCTDIDNGAKDQGTPSQKVAVQYFCHSYLAKFHILQTQAVTGTFTISNGTYDPTNEFENPNYETIGDSCDGNGGYGDLNSSTQVIVTDNHGTELARTELGSGTVDATTDTCVFTFQFKVTEGADQYIVTVGKRGATNYTFDQLTLPEAVDLIIGNH